MEKDLKTLYKERYSGKMKFSTSFPGVNSTIFNALKKELPCKNVLDIGCGSGRLALYCSRVADTVLGIDFSKEAINLAIAIREALEGDFSNAAFRIDRFENIQQKAFDVVVVADVFEHIQGNPKETLRKLSSFLSKDGLLVVSCPGFVNFRGTVWMTLQTLFDFLMSPS
ncbi:MAG: methyltransferase domain-containing protein, partial [Desulfobacteraceae bacterium]|nr:methyltransferase domain-containing protein [Desulfobacteraceae bacterium]